jgi:hypothetical protein
MEQLIHNSANNILYKERIVSDLSLFNQIHFSFNSTLKSRLLSSLSTLQGTESPTL